MGKQIYFCITVGLEKREAGRTETKGSVEVSGFLEMKVDSALGWDYHHPIEMLLTSSGSTSTEGRKFGQPVGNLSK